MCLNKHDTKKPQVLKRALKFYKLLIWNGHHIHAYYQKNFRYNIGEKYYPRDPLSHKSILLANKRYEFNGELIHGCLDYKFSIMGGINKKPTGIRKVSLGDKEVNWSTATLHYHASLPDNSNEIILVAEFSAPKGTTIVYGDNGDMGVTQAVFKSILCPSKLTKNSAGYKLYMKQFKEVLNECDLQIIND